MRLPEAPGITLQGCELRLLVINPSSSGLGWEFEIGVRSLSQKPEPEAWIWRV